MFIDAPRSYAARKHVLRKKQRLMNGASTLVPPRFGVSSIDTQVPRVVRMAPAPHIAQRTDFAYVCELSNEFRVSILHLARRMWPLRVDKPSSAAKTSVYSTRISLRHLRFLSTHVWTSLSLLFHDMYLSYFLQCCSLCFHLHSVYPTSKTNNRFFASQNLPRIGALERLDAHDRFHAQTPPFNICMADEQP